MNQCCCVDVGPTWAATCAVCHAVPLRLVKYIYARDKLTISFHLNATLVTEGFFFLSFSLSHLSVTFFSKTITNSVTLGCAAPVPSADLVCGTGRFAFNIHYCI